MKPDPPEVERIRKILKNWDDGFISLGEFEALVSQPFQNEMLQAVTKGRDWGIFRFYCRAEAKMPETYLVKVEIHSAGFSIHPVKKP